MVLGSTDARMDHIVIASCVVVFDKMVSLWTRSRLYQIPRVCGYLSVQFLQRFFSFGKSTVHCVGVVQHASSISPRIRDVFVTKCAWHEPAASLWKARSGLRKRCRLLKYGSLNDVWNTGWIRSVLLAKRVLLVDWCSSSHLGHSG